MNEVTRSKLAATGISTLTTCLYRRGLRNVWLNGVVPVNGESRMVGEAYTLRFIPAREGCRRYGVPTRPAPASISVPSRNARRIMSW